MARFPITSRNSTAIKMSGVAPNTSFSATPEESRFLIAAGEATAPTQAVNTLAPAVTGTATAGNTLTTTTGTWTGANIVHDYDWQTSNDVGVTWEHIVSGNGATTFVLTAAQLGLRVRCRVRATNGAGPRFANSNTVGPIA
jgi:hypothetical protein